MIKYKKILEGLSKKAVFGAGELHQEGIKKDYSKKLLYMLSKTGKIKRIERGKYTYLDDPIAVATHITHPSYLSLWTAMSIRHLTDQIPFAVEVVSSRKRFKNIITFQGAKIIFYTVPSKLMYGYENMIWKENIRILVAKPEKIVIDAIYTKRVPEGEIFEIVKNSDTGLLKKYASLTGNKKVIKKVKELIEKCSHKKK